MSNAFLIRFLHRWPFPLYTRGGSSVKSHSTSLLLILWFRKGSVGQCYYVFSICLSLDAAQKQAIVAFHHGTGLMQILIFIVLIVKHNMSQGNSE
jgi:hypothetical protein